MPNYCLNGGTCTLINYMPQCTCVDGFYGGICQKGFTITSFCNVILLLSTGISPPMQIFNPAIIIWVMAVAVNIFWPHNNRQTWEASLGIGARLIIGESRYIAEWFFYREKVVPAIVCVARDFGIHATIRQHRPTSGDVRTRNICQFVLHNRLQSGGQRKVTML